MQNTLYSTGDYVVLKHDLPYEGINKFHNFQEKFFDGGKGTFIKKQFRYSFDNRNFSEYVDLTPDALQKIEVNDLIWFNFKYILLSGGPYSINEILLTYDLKDTFISSVSTVSPTLTPSIYKPGFLWNPYEMTKAVQLYKDLNLAVNNLFGHEVWYYRHSPQARNKDVILFEYTMYENEPKQCLKIMVPGNKFPDNKVSVSPMGGNFELPFEIHLDKDYFQSIYGAGTGPQEKDVLYIPITQRIYEIDKAYLYRNFMNVPLYYKVILKKWSPKHDTIMSDDFKDLKSFALSTPQLLGKEIDEEEKNVTDLPQSFPVSKYYDPTRARIEGNFIILKEQIKNFDVDVAEQYYNLQTLLPAENIIELYDNDKISFTIGKKYYIRNYSSGSSSFPDEQYLYSFKILKCLGKTDYGYKFETFGGYSQIERTVTINSIFSSVSPYIIFDREFEVDGNIDGLIANASDFKIRRYRDKIVEYLADTAFSETEDRSFQCWFKLKLNVNSLNSITLQNNEDGSWNITLDKPNKLMNGDTFCLKRVATSNFMLIGKVIAVISDREYRIEFDKEIYDYIMSLLPKWQGYTDLRCQRIEPRVLISSMFNGNGMEIVSFENAYFKLYVNNKSFLFNVEYTATPVEIEKWYGLVVNICNTFKQVSFNLWERQWNSTTNLPATNQLKTILKFVHELKEPLSCIETPNFWITASDTDITNIRIYKMTVESEKQSVILNQQYVTDSSNAILIDNAIPLETSVKLGYTR